MLRGSVTPSMEEVVVRERVQCVIFERVRGEIVHIVGEEEEGGDGVVALNVDVGMGVGEGVGAATGL